MQFREGSYLDRPPFSLHGAEPGRLATQVGATLIIMEEGPPSGSHSTVEDNPRYTEDYKSVGTWTSPRIIDTIGDMVWEDDDEVDGLKIKPLTDDPDRGFRVILKWLPAGWSSDRAPDFARPYYYKNAAREFRFILDGGMTLQAYKTSKKKAETFTVAKNFYIERGPNCICGLPEGVVTETGCVWIETTYANGVSIDAMPIEEPSFS
jgi:hypothetical protein